MLTSEPNWVINRGRPGPAGASAVLPWFPCPLELTPSHRTLMDPSEQPVVLKLRRRATKANFFFFKFFSF